MSSAAAVAASTPPSAPQLAQLDRLVRDVEDRLDALRAEVATEQAHARTQNTHDAQECRRTIEETVRHTTSDECPLSCASDASLTYHAFLLLLLFLPSHLVSRPQLSRFRLELDQAIEDKVYLLERSSHAHSLVRKAERLAAGSHTHAADEPTSADARGEAGATTSDYDWRALKLELNTEIKKNIAAMHAVLEDKLR